MIFFALKKKKFKLVKKREKVSRPEELFSSPGDRVAEVCRTLIMKINNKRYWHEQ